MSRHVYLDMKGLEEARKIFFSAIGDRRTEPEEIPVEAALDRVTSEPVFARISAPTFHSAAMDGIVVRAEDTYGTTERNPIKLQVGKNALWINTGQAIPQGFNAVIMVEKLHQPDEETIEIRSPAYPWQHIRKVGEDIVATQLILSRNHRIRPFDMGALISSGNFSVKVWKKPRVAVIPTGSELIHYRDLKDPKEITGHRIIESNSIILSGLIRKAHSVPIVFDFVPDDPALIRETLKKAVDSDADVIVINAGSSAGSRDYTADLIAEFGRVLVHGVAMMPGKPTILGIAGEKPVIGNPGYMVSASVSFDQFIRPLLYRLQGSRPPEPKTIKVQPARDIPSRLGIEEFLRVNIGRVGEKNVAIPLPRSAGSITTLTRAEGILRIPDLSEGIGREEVVGAELLVEEEDIEKTLVVIGSHDISLDILSDEIRRRGEDLRVSSGNVGSLGGLIALKKGNCHMSGSHLLDVETGVYNISYIERYLKGLKVHVFNFVLRDQGLILNKGNPKGIKGLEDLARDDVLFVNRQAGSGTRVLLDYRLKQCGIEPGAVRGYDHEEFTHMAVAVDVLSGAADCGMGIFAAARALDMDFIPIEREQYDLIIPSHLLEHHGVRTALETIRSTRFRKRVTGLGGYDPSKSGEPWMEVG